MPRCLPFPLKTSRRWTRTQSLLVPVPRCFERCWPKSDLYSRRCSESDYQDFSLKLRLHFSSFQTFSHALSWAALVSSRTWDSTKTRTHCEATVTTQNDSLTLSLALAVSLATFLSSLSSVTLIVWLENWAPLSESLSGSSSFCGTLSDRALWSGQGPRSQLSLYVWCGHFRCQIVA